MHAYQPFLHDRRSDRSDTFSLGFTDLFELIDLVFIPHYELYPMAYTVAFLISDWLGMKDLSNGKYLIEQGLKTQFGATALGLHQ